MTLFARRTFSACLAAALGFTGLAHAADITWGPPQDITGDLSDFNTNGSLVLAYSGDNVDHTIAGLGITFTSAALLGNGVYNADSNGNYATVYPAGDPDYDNLLQNATWSNPAPVSLSLPDLTVGTKYKLQIWAADVRNCCSGTIPSGWEKTFGDGNGNNVTITAGNLNGGVVTALPQFVTGSFTADATTQNLDFLAIGQGNAHPQYNALMLRTDPAGTTTFTGAGGNDIGVAGNWDQGLPTNDGNAPGTVPDGFPALTGDPGEKQITVEGSSGYDGTGFGTPSGDFDLTFNGTGDSDFSGTGIDVTVGSALSWNSSGTATASNLAAAGTVEATAGTVRSGDLSFSGSGTLSLNGLAVFQVLNTAQSVSAIEAFIGSGEIATSDPLGLEVSVVDVGGTDYTQVAVAQLGAGAVTWDAPQDITGLSDIITGGPLVAAVNADNGGEVVVDPGGLDMTFTPDNTMFATQNPFTTSFAPSTGDAGFDAILNRADWDGTNPNATEVVIGGLNVGTKYAIQMFVADTRGCCNSRSMEITSGGSTATVYMGDNGGSPAPAQFVVGRFTAEQPTQAFTFTGTHATAANLRHPQLNAYVLRVDSAVLTTFTGAIDDDIGKAGNWDNGLPTNDGLTPGIVPDGFPALTGDPGNKDITFEGNSGYDGDGFASPSGPYAVTFEGSGNANFSGGGLSVPAGSRLVWSSSGDITATAVDVAGSLRLNTGSLQADDLAISGTLTIPRGSASALRILNSAQNVAAIEALIAGGQIITTEPLGLLVEVVDVGGTDYTQVTLAMLGQADITWGDPQDITGSLDDFDVTGEVVLALSGDNVDVTVAGLGINFASAGILANGVYNADSDGNFALVYPGADPDYDNLLQNATWANTPQESLVLEGLNPGTDYKLQLWASDVRNCCSGLEAGGWEKTFGDGNGNDVTITAGNLNGGVANTLPQYVIGTFTAEAPTQNLEFINVGQGNAHPQYNALLLTTNVPAAPPVEITDVSHDASTGMLSLSWTSLGGKLYNVRSSADPATETDPATWPIFGGLQDIAATPPENTVTFPLPADRKRLFVIEVFDAPPVAVFADAFENGQGAWTVGSDATPGTVWELGSPLDDGIGPASAFSGTNCWATDLDAIYTEDANIWLRSPAIDLSGAGGATLNYMEFKDIELTFDLGRVAVLDAADDSEIAVITPIVEGASVDWTLISSAIPAAALDKVIKIEFRLDSDEFQGLAGWYFDEFSVTVP